MAVYRKNTWLAVSAVVLGLIAFPISYSEAQSSQQPFSALECGELGSLRWEQMSARQKTLSAECDMVEAAHDWEQQYGSLDAQAWHDAAVYE